MPTQLDKELAKFAAEKEAAAKAEQVLKEHEKNAQDAAERIAQLMKSGVKTGDPIRDHVLGRGHGPDPDEEKLLRSLEKELKGKTGELVMLLYWEEVRRRQGERSEPRVLFGVLRGEKLLFEKNDFERTAPALPVDCYAERNYMGTWEIERKRIVQGSGSHGMKFERLVVKKGGRIERKRYHSYVLAGTKRIREFIQNPHDYGISSYSLFNFKEGLLEQVFKDLGFLELTG